MQRFSVEGRADLRLTEADDAGKQPGGKLLVERQGRPGLLGMGGGWTTVATLTTKREFSNGVVTATHLLDADGQAAGAADPRRGTARLSSAALRVPAAPRPSPARQDCRRRRRRLRPPCQPRSR